MITPLRTRIATYTSTLLSYLKTLPRSLFRKLFPSSKKKTAPDSQKATPLPESVAAPLLVRQDEKHPCSSYMDLKRRFRDIGQMKAVAETMGRDFLTAMPEGAWKSRLSQIIYLHRRVHEDLGDKEVSHQLDRAQSHLENHPEDWDIWDRRNLELMRKTCARARYVDGGLTEKETRLAYEGRRQHRHVLATGDWMQGREYLNTAIDTKRRIGEAICQGTGQNDPYSALMNEYLPDTKLGTVEKWFETLRKDLSTMLPKIIEKQANEPSPQNIANFYPAKAQKWLNTALLEALGFDFERGGLYETGHNPVEGGTPDDTRLVIKLADTTDFMDSMKSTLHEGGHGIYIQGLPRDTWRYQPVGQDMGAAIHESQALLIDMIVGRSMEFFEFLSPRVQGLFHGLKNPVLSAENLYKIKTRVQPGLLRRKADEVSYFFHILHRFRLERDLIDGKLKLNDLPEAWNGEMETLLKLKPETYGQGCLQDVHWFVGKFGYFPAYAVGHMLAAQQYEAIKKQTGNLKDQIRAGDFQNLTTWMHQNIHRKGSLFDTETLIKDITGDKISPAFLVTHLENRYLKAA